MTVEELSIIIKADINDALKGIKTVTEAVKSAVEGSIAPIEKMTAKTHQIANASASSIGKAKAQMSSFKSTIADTTAQQQQLINKINDLKATLVLAEQDPKLFSKSEVLEMRVEVEKLEKQLGRLQAPVKQTGSTINKAFSNGVKSLKRFAFSLFAVRSAFSLVSRSMREYLATNDEANAKYQLATNIIGQTLAPVMGKLLDIIQYVTIGFALLIKMFTGFDILSKVTTKNINKTTKATKDLNKELTSMDEITNLSGKNTGTGLDLTADLKALDDFNKKVGDVQKLFDDWDISSFVNKLKDLYDWIVKNSDALLQFAKDLAIAFATFKFTMWIANIAGLIGTAGTGAAIGTGLVGLASLLGTLAAIGAIAISVAIIVSGISKVVEAYNELKKLQNQNKTQQQANEDTLYDLISKYETKKRTTGLTKQEQTVLDKLYKDKSNLETRGTFFPSGSSRWADGGVITKPTFGLAGEYAGASSNPEIITPQNIMAETFERVLSALLPQTQPMGDVVLNVNGRELAKATYQDFQYEGNRLGSNTIVRRVG
jgi:archaellum component FlaC